MSISVIIPVYQAEKFIKKAVQSACTQDEVTEVVLVEDGSKDSSLDICESLVKQYSNVVKLFQHKGGINKGISASRNLGINKARGDFIAFLDADDYYLPERFKNDIDILKSNSDIDGVYNALGVFIYDESERGRVESDLTTLEKRIHPDNLFEEIVPIGTAGYFHGDGITVRKSIFEKVGMFDEDLKVTEDTHMWLKMAAKASLVAGIIDQPVAVRGVHEQNSVKDRVQVKQYRLLMYTSLLDWANKNNISVHRKRLIWERLYNAYVSSLVRIQKNPIVTKMKILRFLLKQVFVNPYLLGYRPYVSAYWRDAI